MIIFKKNVEKENKCVFVTILKIQSWIQRRLKASSLISFF